MSIINNSYNQNNNINKNSLDSLQNLSVSSMSQKLDTNKNTSASSSSNLAKKDAPMCINPDIRKFINVDAVISQISTNPIQSEKNGQLSDLFAQLLDNDDYNGAVRVINATPSPMYKNAMFKALVQELVVYGYYNEAINLNNSYSDSATKNEVKDYISSYLKSSGNYSGAAQALGDTSFFSQLKLRASSTLDSVKSFFSGFTGSVGSVFTTSTRANIIGAKANSIIGQQYRQASVSYGTLACAYAASQALKKVPGLQNVGSAECNELAKQLENNGFSRLSTKNYKAGDVVFFTRKDKAGFGHVGIVAEVKNGIPYMVHNSSSSRQVVKVRLDQYYKTPVAVYRSN